MRVQKTKSGLLQACWVWGVAWGAAEATLGHLLHALPVPGLAGLVMIPAGVLFMTRAVRETGAPAAAAVVAGVAAVIKMADVFLPGRGLMMALRPALAILTEGLFAAVLLSALPVPAARRRK